MALIRRATWDDLGAGSSAHPPALVGGPAPVPAGEPYRPAPHVGPVEFVRADVGAFAGEERFVRAEDLGEAPVRTTDGGDSTLLEVLAAVASACELTPEWVVQKDWKELLTEARRDPFHKAFILSSDFIQSLPYVEAPLDLAASMAGAREAEGLGGFRTHRAALLRPEIVPYALDASGAPAGRAGVCVPLDTTADVLVAVRVDVRDAAGSRPKIRRCSLTVGEFVTFRVLPNRDNRSEYWGETPRMLFPITAYLTRAPELGRLELEFAPGPWWALAGLSVFVDLEAAYLDTAARAAWGRRPTVVVAEGIPRAYVPGGEGAIVFPLTAAEAAAARDAASAMRGQRPAAIVGPAVDGAPCSPERPADTFSPSLTYDPLFAGGGLDAPPGDEAGDDTRLCGVVAPDGLGYPAPAPPATGGGPQ